MAIMHLQGATGNQLFCLFAGIAHEVVSEDKVIFDESFLQPIEVRHPGGLTDFELRFGGDVYSINLRSSRLSKKQIFIDRLAFRVSNLRKEFNKLSRQHRSKVFGFDEDFDLNKRYKKVLGFFQTYSYADIAQDSLGKLEVIVKSPSDWFYEKSSEICTSSNSVAVHIRRGDYAQNKNGIGLLSVDYFLLALDHLIEQKDVRRVYIFSDECIDIKRFKSRFPEIDFQILLSPENSKPIESIVLMSLTTYRIISNSSFSWWAGYLSKDIYSNYAPDPWFRNKAIPEFLIPKSWTKLQSIW